MRWSWPAVWAEERGGWWRLAVTLMLSVGGAFLGLLLSFAVMPGSARSGMGNPANPATMMELARLFAGFLPKALALVGLLAGIRFVHRRPIRCVFTDGRPIRIGFAMQSAALWTLLWFAGALVQPQGWEGFARRAVEVAPAWWPVITGSLLVGSAIAITLEEVLFRGYLQTRVAAWVKRPWLAVCIIALLFTVMHRGGNSAAYTAITFAAILFGVASIRAGTLAPLLGMHTMHDMLEVLWHPNDTNAGSTWLDVVVWVIGLLIWFGWLLWATRSRPIDSSVQSGARQNVEGHK